MAQSQNELSEIAGNLDRRVESMATDAETRHDVQAGKLDGLAAANASLRADVTDIKSASEMVREAVQGLQGALLKEPEVEIHMSPSLKDKEAPKRARKKALAYSPAGNGNGAGGAGTSRYVGGQSNSPSFSRLIPLMMITSLTSVGSSVSQRGLTNTFSHVFTATDGWHTATSAVRVPSGAGRRGARSADGEGAV